MSNVKERVRLNTTDATIAQAQDVSRLLHTPQGTLHVSRENDSEVALPDELHRILAKVIDVMARGGSVTISALPEEVTTTTAAAILGVSRPTVMKMIGDGQLPSHKVGTHHRLASADVYAVLAARRERERAAFEELRSLDG